MEEWGIFVTLSHDQSVWMTHYVRQRSSSRGGWRWKAIPEMGVSGVLVERQESFVCECTW
jgi:hypothetical protein